MAPHGRYEHQLHAAGYRAVAGIDEAGRGCWAGPVVAAAVVLSPALLADAGLCALLNDSKQLRATQRDVAYVMLQQHAHGLAAAAVPAYLIDAYGIVPATRLAMLQALLMLPCAVDALLIDAVRLPLALPQQVLTRGDAQVLSIAAASIVAKVHRDRLMTAADAAYPGYAFAAHKGYGTAAHQQALRRLGVCPLHRRTFRPVLATLPDESAMVY